MIAVLDRRRKMEWESRGLRRRRACGVVVRRRFWGFSGSGVLVGERDRRRNMSLETRVVVDVHGGARLSCRQRDVEAMGGWEIEGMEVRMKLENGGEDGTWKWKKSLSWQGERDEEVRRSFGGLLRWGGDDGGRSIVWVRKKKKNGLVRKKGWWFFIF